MAILNFISSVLATFEELNTLISLVATHGQQPLPLLGKWEQRPGKETTLFENMRAGRYSNDEQAAGDLYEGSPPDKRYAMLKARLWQKLLNHLFFLDFTDKGQSICYCQQECLNMLHYSKMLRLKGEFGLAEKQAVKAVGMAKQGEYSALVVQGLEMLQFLYAQNHQPKNYQLVMEELTHYRQLSQWEIEANDLYLNTRLLYNKSIKKRRDSLKELPTIVMQLEVLWKKASSIAIFERYNKLKTWYLEMINDFEAVLEHTKEVESLMKEGKLNLLIYDHTFNVYIHLYACLRMKRYEEGMQFAETHLDVFERTSHNWFGFMEIYLLMAIHAQQYPLANQLFQQVDKNRLFCKLMEFAKEKWTLYRAYIAWVEPMSQLRENLDYASLIQSIPQMTKDKLGFNVATLVLQFLHDLRTGDLDLLHCRMENLKQYTKRYLSDRHAQRSRLFFRLLALVVTHQLEVEVCRKKGTRLLAQLRATPSPGDAFAEIEIIPYEHLWERVLSTLEQKEVKAI
ncbi:MAG: hypothetical protein V4714_08015 [Bacteroidota bacterium]